MICTSVHDLCMICNSQAAQLVELLDNNKLAVKIVAGGIYLGFIGFVAYIVVAKNQGWLPGPEVLQ